MKYSANSYIGKKLIRGETSIFSVSFSSLLIALLFVILSVEEGFFVRPAYFFMGGFIFLNIGYFKIGCKVMPAAVWAIVLVVLSVFQSLDWALSVKFAVHAVFTILFGVISSGYIYSRGEDVLNWWYEMYILSGVITGFYSVIQFFVFISFPSVGELWVGGIPRAYALTTEPSYLAFFLVPIFFVAFSNYRYKAAIIIAAGILFSTSRTGLVGLVGGGAALAFIRPREFGQLAWQAIKYAGGVVLLFLVVPAIQEGIVRFFQFVWKGFTDLDVGSAYVRLLSWFYALELFLEHPIFGVGVQGYGPAMHAKGLMLNRDAEEVRTTMLYLEILAEYGIVGFLVFVWWLTSPLFVLWRHRMDERAAGLLTALSSMLLMFPFIQNWWRPYLWIAWVLAYVLAARYQSDQV